MGERRDRLHKDMEALMGVRREKEGPELLRATIPCSFASGYGQDLEAAWTRCSMLHALPIAGLLRLPLLMHLPLPALLLPLTALLACPPPIDPPAEADNTAGSSVAAPSAADSPADSPKTVHCCLPYFLLWRSRQVAHVASPAGDGGTTTCNGMSYCFPSR